MAQHLRILLTICFVSLAFLGVATGTGNTHVEETRNYAEAAEINDEEQHRTRRDVAKQVEEQSVAVEASGREEEGNANADSNNNRNSLQPNFGELKESNIVKRAPSGFTGMRGKKDYEITDTLGWGNVGPNPLTYQDEDRDMDSSDDTYDLVYGKPNGRRYKKAPTAFYGVRGKKYATGGNNDFNRLDDFLQKFEEDRMRETMLQDFIDRLAVSTVAQNEIAKRAPTGFTGMRGKRPAAAAIENFYDYGDDGEGGVAKKRAPSNSFMGVRGKKDVSHQAFKRSPTSDSFNNARAGGGKSQRFVDFSNKFVAVRGKKASSSSLPSGALLATATGDAGGGVGVVNNWSSELASDGGRFPPQQRLFVNVLPSLLFGGSNGKRTPSGFLGMRGKREANAAIAVLIILVAPTAALDAE